MLASNIKKVIHCNVRMRSCSTDGVYYVLKNLDKGYGELENLVIVGHTEKGNFRDVLKANLKNLNGYRTANGFLPIYVDNFRDCN